MDLRVQRSIAVEVPSRCHGLLRGGKDAWYMLQKECPRTRQASEACGAGELCTQFLDSAWQWRLVDMQSLGSTGEVAFLC